MNYPRFHLLIVSLACMISLTVLGFLPVVWAERAGQPELAPVARGYNPITLKNAASTTVGRYVNTVNPATMKELGRKRGRAAQSGVPFGNNVTGGVILLAMGTPRYENGSYGALLYSSGGFHSTTEIATAVENFIDGYVETAPAYARIELVVGVTSNTPTYLTYDHGQAWGAMIGSIKSYIDQHPGYASKVLIAGGFDAEPGWLGTGAMARNWANGFSSISPVRYLNYGSCDSCPFFACPNCVPPPGWTIDDIWYVSWGNPAAWPLPEIYRADSGNADQWARMNSYSATALHGYMQFRGVVTQWQACQEDFPQNPIWPTPRRCLDPATDNPPSQGWRQLWEFLTPRQNLPVGVDMSWYW